MSLSASSDARIHPHSRALHPLHAFLLAGATCFLVAGFLSDWSYYSSFEIQWKNFANWLIFGGLVFGGAALLWAFAGLIRARVDRGRHLLYVLLLLAAWIMGFINELIHAKDAWASMPDALIISAITALLVLVAAVLGFSTLRMAERWT